MAGDQSPGVFAPSNTTPEALSLNVKVGGLSDVAPLVALSESVYGFLPDGSTKSYYHWLYDENPDGSVLIGNAESGGELVGHYALVPVRLWCAGREIVGGLGVNALTRRDFQGRAVFARLVTLVNEAAACQGISLTYVVPSPQATPWYLKMLRFSERSSVRLWARPLRLAPLLQCLPGAARVVSGIARLCDTVLAPGLRFVRARHNPHRLEIRTIEEFGVEFDALWKEAKGRFHFAVIRSQKRLQWRFCAVPTRQYQIWGAYWRDHLAAYVVIREREFQQLPGQQVGVIADLFGRTDVIGLSGARLLVAHALRWLAQKGIALCVMQLTSTIFESALRANGFFPVPHQFSENRALLIRSFNPEHTAVSEDELFHFTGGDHDMG